MNYKKYLFLDRDGTLIEEPADYQVDSVKKFRLLPNVIPSLLTLQKTGYVFVMVSNQDGLGTESYPRHRFEEIQNLLVDILRSQGIQFESILICPHLDQEKCFCRKPQVGLVRDFLSMRELDRNKSFVIGDRNTDLAFAKNMGIPGIQINATYGWLSITRDILSQPRKGTALRTTKETKIKVQVNLEDSSVVQISTGIGFFDHMLEQLSFHGSFGTHVEVKGDLDIDDHHTIEDTAISLGAALRQALGDKVGINRFGFYLPMDDASTRVSLDLSGRSYFRFEGQLSRDSIGGMSTEMIPHFFRSFSESLGANLHIHVDGLNTHHQIESIFKAVGRSLRSAIQLPREDSDIGQSRQVPSTKGIL
jgi:imidazoleglycerol-phosphate dehydratase / histidinol-phosphatase